MRAAGSPTAPGVIFSTGWEFHEDYPRTFAVRGRCLWLPPDQAPQAARVVHLEEPRRPVIQGHRRHRRRVDDRSGADGRRAPRRRARRRAGSDRRGRPRPRCPRVRRPRSAHLIHGSGRTSSRLSPPGNRTAEGVPRRCSRASCAEVARSFVPSTRRTRSRSVRRRMRTLSRRIRASGAAVSLHRSSGLE